MERKERIENDPDRVALYAAGRCSSVEACRYHSSFGMRDASHTSSINSTGPASSFMVGDPLIQACLCHDGWFPPEGLVGHRWRISHDLKWQHSEVPDR
jgi:hypothetical protein